ncbi:MAG: bifunctional proline dehydrogenase/L-glutamate gamma-semialdehyde dehydrogenase PutA [Gammaproteobacteria bacterium]|nr:bifunctional proline dehydrogenase/L-glutamate gamma-semialdehyde dehydrogenase PutA [Gammaproteobacteria bacterium]NNF48540.1 bifunctional proline dehydrogenase/L-glutamate gamma-semialdehyde dehydrogenase PutA [Woeseiaceae bacterium]MBT8095182.1 bifunctional proline dehydrogenase/L-glutamate gamma-semialdehyde dehydrogenase PutA [Gammaproteobacteria bacterium]MBT8105340.1 bifunctional proline dehydrogenase/L-glutamate gamma-semialdehyde dehydrogenase PutA [Gammaproteobacteria bacterium]NNK
MRFLDQPAAQKSSIPYIDDNYLADEQALVRQLADEADPGESARHKILTTAEQLVRAVRKNTKNDGGIEAFLQQYDLSSGEGVLLMCIAEALLRIPDADTADRLIADKITAAHWQDHVGTSDSLFVNASTWGLMLTGKILTVEDFETGNPVNLLRKLVSRAGEPVVRAAMRQAMKIMGHQFVMGRTIGDALKRAVRSTDLPYRYSFDMLGESALTAADATRYLESYHEGIKSIGDAHVESADIFSAPGISVKLSALHPRFEYSQEERVMAELVPAVLELAKHARDVGIGLTIDSEEAHRFEMWLAIFERVYRDASLRDYEGFGVALQTYQRRGRDGMRFLIDLAGDVGRRIPVRLVKGAYWDSEVKWAQEQGLDSYPVFTRKSHSDVSYLAAARAALAAGDRIYAQFATHNAHTLASVLHYAGSRRDYEFQRLHGMGEELYAEVVDPEKHDRPCRVYAPVGNHEDLLPYLVRRLLENGSNTSFVNKIADETIEVSEIIADPLETAARHDYEAHDRIPAPCDIFQPERVNSSGVNLADRSVSSALLADLDAASERELTARPIVGGKEMSGVEEPSVNPADTSETVGVCHQVTADGIDKAIEISLAAQSGWDRLGGHRRAAILNRAADLYESHRDELLGLIVREGGRSIPDAISELREAVDFMRYYGAQAEKHFGEPIVLPGPTGERNTLSMRGKGVFIAISPWNFPLAIYTGQITAALAAGNAVLAKPAAPTTLIGYRAVQLLHEAGVPADVLHFVPGSGRLIGERAVADPRIAGVVFTGSTEVAQTINQTLAHRDGPIGTLIAETGGQNAMFVDSSALPEQVVHDAIYSAFNSAGQRCSALRVLCVQEEIEPRTLDLLKGYMEELTIGDPRHLSTDVGPCIDDPSRQILAAHVERMGREQTVVYRCALSHEHQAGTYFAPTLVEIDDIGALTEEQFGPVLHVVKFKGRHLDKMVQAVNGTGFGLTMGLHSRIDSRMAGLAADSGAGNLYVNRNMIGAVVGVQPFGGRGLSGTGPKAGGPNYVQRFGTEFTLSNNISAVGGNASLLTMGSD